MYLKNNKKRAISKARELGATDEELFDVGLLIYRSKGYWTLETCKAEALKYKTRWEWQKAHNKSYNAAHRNNWLETCCSHMENLIKPNGYWTLELCKAEALKYKIKIEWQKGHHPSYAAAKRNNWIKDCSLHMQNLKRQNYWTLELCKAEALKYKTKGEWKKGNRTSYQAAVRNNWLKAGSLHMISNRKLNK